MAGPPEIRRLAGSDAPQYRELRLRALREHPEAFTSSWEEESAKPLDWYGNRLTGEGKAFFAAFERGELCAMAGLEREQRRKNRHKGIVVGMYVAPEQGGRGIAGALLEAVIDEARSQGIEQLLLTVTEGNGTAERLYLRAGFRSFGIEPRAVRVDERYYGKNHMFLDLSNPS
jgi:GNAT superfamily N-acetyltransferase